LQNEAEFDLFGILKRESVLKKLLLATVVGSAVLISACASPRPYNRIDANARPLIKSMDSVVMVKQSEIGSDIVVSNATGAMGGGLIPALIDAGVNSSRTKKAEEAIGPIRDKLIDYDFGAEVEKQLNTAFSGTTVSGLNNVKLMRAEDPKYRENTVKASGADAVMFIDTTYKISANFDAVLATANVRVFPVSADLNAYKEKPDEDDKVVEPTDNIYRNTFMASAPLDLVSDMETNASDAANLPVDKYTMALDRAAKNLAEKIAADLMTDDDVTADK